MSTPTPQGRPLKKGDIVDLQTLDEGVYHAQHEALRRKMIPIAGVISRAIDPTRHEILGIGWNHLAEGIPGIHGETGAVMNMGRRETGYSDLTATSSLTPCEFCQFTLACHMGIRHIRVLGKAGFTASDAGYATAGITPERAHVHQGINDTFDAWVNEPPNLTLWNRDIGIYNHPTPPPYDGSRPGRSFQDLMALAHLKAAEAVEYDEAPLGAVILDHEGEVIAGAHAKLLLTNDPTATAPMAAWRAAGGRDHWKDKTLLLTAGPDHIAYAMFHVFNFGQLVLASDRVFAGRTRALETMERRRVPVHILNDPTSDPLLQRWIDTTPINRTREYLGADFNPPLIARR